MLDLDFDEASIVLLGELNPRIFQPEWFGANGLLRKKEVAMASESPGFIIASQLTQFTADWVEVQVTSNRFLARTCDPGKYSLLRDFAYSTFQILQHTPVRMLGLNRALAFLTSSGEQWHHIGHTLAPKEPWQGIVESPGMLEVHMECKARVDAADYLRVKVRPTFDPQGVRFDFNEQFGGEFPTALEFTSIIEQEWDHALNHFQAVAEHLLAEIVDGIS